MRSAKWAGIIPILFLAACATAAPPGPHPVDVQRVLIPVAKACVPATIPPAPTNYADDNLTLDAGKGPERYRAIAEANEQRRARLAVVEPAIAACR